MEAQLLWGFFWLKESRRWPTRSSRAGGGQLLCLIKVVGQIVKVEVIRGIECNLCSCRVDYVGIDLVLRGAWKPDWRQRSDRDQGETLASDRRLTVERLLVA